MFFFYYSQFDLLFYFPLFIFQEFVNVMFVNVTCCSIDVTVNDWCELCLQTENSVKVADKSILGLVHMCSSRDFGYRNSR